ncbi:MAG: glycosyltransferase family 39 protein, partial [Acidobacteriota bacterium]
MPAQKRSERLSAAAVIIALSGVLLHVVVNYITPYGIHRDEFLYLAMGERLRLWQMDFPPFIALIAEWSRAWFGDSLRAIRLFPAVTAGLLIVLAADFARRLGGGASAQVLAAVFQFVPILFLRTGALFQPVIFDQLWWTLGMWCLLRWRQSSDNRWWIALGLVLGMGLLTKFSILIFGFGVLIGLLATKERKLLATRWPWIALALTLAIGSPSIVGQ